MSATLRWIVERRLLTLAGFAVILLGAFIPWPSLAIAAVVIVLGAVLLAVQIPIAMRDATEQLDGADEPEEQWQAPSYPQYQAEPYQQPASPMQPEPSPRMYEPAPVWQPKNFPQAPQPEPAQAPQQSQHPEPSRQMYEPVPVWQPTRVQGSPEPEPAPVAEPSRRAEETGVPWRPQNIPQYRPEP